MKSIYYKPFLVWYTTLKNDEVGKCVVVYASTARQAKIKFKSLKGHRNHKPYMTEHVQVFN